MRDKRPASKPITWVYVGGDLGALKALVNGLGDSGLTQRLGAVDASTNVVVTLYYDGCTKAEPSLVLDGAAITVQYGQELNRNCVRAVDTLVLFAVPRASLPDPVTLQVCGATISLTRDAVSGDPIGLC